MSTAIQFYVPGIAMPQGSKKFMGVGKGGRGILVESCKGLPSWRNAVSAMADIEMRKAGLAPYAGAVSLSVDFYFQKPKSTSKKVCHKITKPDLSKLIRAVEDAMTGIVYRDDSQITAIRAGKWFGESAGCDIVMTLQEAK